LDRLRLLTVDNGGTVDGVVIGGSEAGEITSTTLNTGQGAKNSTAWIKMFDNFSCNLCNSRHRTGANELYDMDQNY
jgi:hypothetical protein